MTVLGKLATVLAFVSSVLATIRYYGAGTQAAMKAAKFWLIISASCVILASLFLFTLFLLPDFSNGYVYSYSSRDLPLHFLISCFYAGQEGSFLFWVLCAAVASIFLLRTNGLRSDGRWVLSTFMAVQSILLLLVLAKSPFRFVWEMFPDIPLNQIPSDGRGLNPLLQNFWMVVHPPVLFIGFAVTAVPFCYAIAGLWKNDVNILATRAFTWVLFATTILGAGIMLGAYWAYGVLGWGGYWGWDPVENSSLVPWITSVTLIHTLLAQRRTGRFVRTNFILAIISFVLVMYSTFLTRSGVLGDSSVHSFSDPGAGVYWILIVCMTLMALGGLALIIRRWRQLASRSGDTKLFSRETGVAAGAVVLVLSAVVILFGTSLPIFSASTVEPSFYDNMMFPLAIAMALLIGFTLYMHWEGDDGAAIIRRGIWSLVVSAAVTLGLHLAGVNGGSVLGFIFASVFALVCNVEVGWKIAQGDPRFLGGKITHIGIALFLIGVVATGRFSSTQHLVLALHTPQNALGYKLTYVGYTPLERGRFAFHIDVENNTGRFRLAPVMFDAGQQGLMRTPDIASFLTRDLYISPVSLQRLTAQGSRDDRMYTIPKGGSVAIGDVKATFVGFNTQDQHTGTSSTDDQHMAIGSVLELRNGSAHETVMPMTIYGAGESPRYISSPSKLINGSIQLVSMNVGHGSEGSAITVRVSEAATGQQTEGLVVEASVKPYINLVWGGTIVMLCGLIVSILKRSKEH